MLIAVKCRRKILGNYKTLCIFFFMLQDNMCDYGMK